MSHVEKPYATTIMVCCVVIEKDGKYLFVQEKQEAAYKKWNFPSGRVDEGEDLERAAVREAKEETGYDVKLIEEILLLHPAANRPVFHVYSAEIIGGELDLPEHEILDAKWLSKEEIKAMEADIRNPELQFKALGIEA